MSKAISDKRLAAAGPSTTRIASHLPIPKPPRSLQALPVPPESNAGKSQTRKSSTVASAASSTKARAFLQEGIAQRAVDIDITYIYGYGFPAWRGGPMFYADTVGLPKILARIQDFEKKHGSDLWSPAPLLVRLAAEGKKFKDFDKQKEAQ